MRIIAETSCEVRWPRRGFLRDAREEIQIPALIFLGLGVADHRFAHEIDTGTDASLAQRFGRA
jgi:hypothetical protein